MRELDKTNETLHLACLRGKMFRFHFHHVCWLEGVTVLDVESGPIGAKPGARTRLPVLILANTL